MRSSHWKSSSQECVRNWLANRLIMSRFYTLKFLMRTKLILLLISQILKMPALYTRTNSLKLKMDKIILMTRVSHVNAATVMKSLPVPVLRMSQHTVKEMMIAVISMSHNQVMIKENTNVSMWLIRREREGSWTPTMTYGLCFKRIAWESFSALVELSNSIIASKLTKIWWIKYTRKFQLWLRNRSTGISADFTTNRWRSITSWEVPQRL